MSGLDAALIGGTIAILVIMPIVIAAWAVTFLKNKPPRDLVEGAETGEA